MILHAHRCAFFHIPKTAGYSIEQALLPGDLDYRRFHPEVIFGLKDGVMTQHLPYSHMLKLVPRATLDACFKFTFTRHTWDRLVSAYEYLRPQHEARYGGFEGWLRMACAEVKRGMYIPTEHFAPQMDYLLHEGRDVLDFIGAYEKLQTDFDKVCSALHLPRSTLKHTNRSRLRTGHYSAYYNARTRDLVAETYAPEIERFGYRFEPA